jgi:YD repeat-containing protein
MDKLFKTVILLLSIIGLSLPLSYADDLDPHYKFSGVKAPDSPYKNTWGAFQTDLYSGSLGYEYKIEVPPGTNGLKPDISIRYNSHSAKGKAGWVGAGWEIPLSYIQRNIQYTRKDTSDDTFELYLDGAKHDLVYVASENRWHTKNESYLKIEKKTGGQNTLGEYWVVTDKDGTEYRFGYNPASENLVQSSDASFSPYVWRWSLERIHDPNDNCICFNYIEDQGSVYLDNIKYNSCNNDGNRVIQFIRESKPDAYLIIDQGSEVYDAYRLSEINISVNGSLARKYKLAYAMNELQNKSLLTSITQYGADGVSALPPVKFEYKALEKGFNEGINWTVPAGREWWIREVDSDNDVTVETFDVNGDGLPDLVRYEPYHWNIWLNTKNGFSSSNSVWQVPSSPDGGWDIRDVETYPAHTPNTRSSPMDINGDGYIDFLWAYGNTTLLVDLNDHGNSFLGVTSWGLPVTAWIREVQNPNGVAANVKQEFFDMNGDGLPDLVKRSKVNSDNYNAWHIWRNTGSGFVDFGEWLVSHGNAWLTDFTRPDPVYTQISHYDMNGDGLPDIVDGNSSPWKIYLNTGSNFIYAGSWNTAYGDYLNDVNSSGDVKRDIVDINGDGLPDIVNPVDNQQDWEVQFNTGKGFTSKILWHVPGEVPANGYVNNLIGSNVGRDVFDINGDGVPDLVRHIDNVSYWRVYSNESGQADLLSKITDTLGGTVSINYTASMNFDNTRLPFNYWLVSSVATNNEMTGPHALAATTGFSYTQGLYDFPTREFRGFGQVTETRADSSKVIHYYYQDEAKKGKEYKTETKNSADAPFASIQNAFSEALSNGVYTSNIIQTDEYTFDGIPDNPRVKRKEYQNYDSFGNVGLLIDYDDWNSGGDEVYTYNEYWPSCSSAYIVDKLKHKYIKPSAAGSTLRESFYWYDNSTSCVSKGNLTKEENWLNTGNNPVTLHEYDAYGNRTKTTDPDGHPTQYLYDGTTYFTFPVQIINAKNQVTKRYYNLVSGEITEEIEPNGNKTTYGYDTFQRKIKEIKPYDTDTLPTTSIQYFLYGTPPGTVRVSKRESTGGTGTLVAAQFVDGFGNLIQTKTESSDFAAYCGINVDIFYDNMGRLKKQTNPYLLDSTLNTLCSISAPPYDLPYTVPYTNTPSTSYDYDALGRPLRVTNPDASHIDRTFYHWQVTETDENGHPKSYSFDASQRLKQVIENNGGALYSTNYTYDPLGELVGINDHLGNVTTISYDSLGRKTGMTDPDMGTWGYGYDSVGNLISQTDARGITTSITYDELNRKKVINYPNSTDIQFTYDNPTIGTLSQVIDGAGTANYQYDQRLRKVQESRTMDSNTWTTQWTYDSMDRITSMTYPDNQIVQFNYNAQGKLAGISGIAAMNYNANGQVTQKNYANGKSTTYVYHPSNLRLTSLATSGIQNFTYTYDSVGNIKSIADGIAGKTENFAYDDLDRLTSAGDSGYSLQYQYNAIGNMTSMMKDGKTTTFSYGAVNNKPHAVKGMTVPYPVVGSLAINNGSAYTTTNQVTLNNVSIGSPTHYMASENKLFTGASWLTYSTAPTFTLSAGFGTKTIYFKVKNTDGESNVKSDSIEYVPTPLNAPTSLNATAVSQTQINLSWQDNSSDESDFHIERSPNGSTGWAEIATVGVNVTNYNNNTGLSCNTPYYYRVRAHRHGDAQYSGYSNTANTTTQLCAGTYTLNVNIIPSVGGTVSGTGINCPGDCSEIYNSGTNLTLIATPNSGYIFSFWSGCNSVSGPTCYVTMNSIKTVTANFTQISWISISGLTASSPALAWNPSANKLQIVVRASNDTLWKATFNSSGVFNNDWINIPGLTASAPALAWNPVINKMQMVVRASNNTLWASTFNSSGVFNNDWVNISGLTPDAPALAWNPLANEMQLIVRGSDGPSIWTATFNSSGAFNNDWVNIPGGMASSPALAWNPVTNEMQMVVRASNSTLWASTFSSSGVFNNDWINISGLTASSPALAWSDFTSSMNMMVRASNDTIWSSTFNSSGVFNNDWLNIPGLTASSPAMVYLPSIGYIDVVVRASDGSLWEMLY